MSSALDLSATSAIKYSFNSRSVTLSRKENLEIDIRHVLSVCKIQDFQDLFENTQTHIQV